MPNVLSIVFGFILLLLGIAGFIPGVTTVDANGTPLLAGLFLADAAHNSLYIVSGTLGVITGSLARYAKWYLIGCGLLYALLARVGFFAPAIIDFFSANTADTLLHAVLAVGLLGAGLGLSDDKKQPIKAVA